MAESKAGFFQASNEMFDIGLNIYQIGVYAYLTRCANNKKSAFPSYKTIADKCGISKPKAISTVAELEKLGLVKKQVRMGEGRNKTNTYRVVFAQKGKHGLPIKVNDVNPIGKQHLPYKELTEEELDEEELHYTALASGDHPFIEIYLNYFKKKKRRMYNRVTESNYIHIINAIEHIASQGITDEDWEIGVKDHFRTLPDGNDGDILPFLEASFRHFEVHPYDLY